MDALCFSLWFSMSVCSVDEARQSGTMLGCWWVLPCPSAPPNYSTTTPTHQEVHKSLLLARNWMPHAMHISFCGGLLFERWHRVYIQLVTRCFRGQFVDDHYTCDDCRQPHPIRSIAWRWQGHDLTTQHIYKHKRTYLKYGSSPSSSNLVVVCFMLLLMTTAC